jgi:plasmid stabilization system protein ParE
MVFEIVYSLEAEQDLDVILTWLLEEGAGETGLRWFQRLQDGIGALSELPHRCPLARENASVPFEMRQLVYGRKPHVYRVLFTIEGNKVYIVHVRGPKQKAVSLH